MGISIQVNYGVMDELAAVSSVRIGATQEVDPSICAGICWINSTDITKIHSIAWATS
jgi:hypothetical protein